MEVDETELKTAQERLPESQERYRAIFEGVSVGIAQVSLDGKILDLNGAACDIFGCAREDLLAMGVADVSHPDDLEADLAQAARLLAGEIGSYRMEKRLARQDGATAWVDLTVSLVRSEAGEPLYFVSVFEIVTERREAEDALRASEARQRFLAELGEAAREIESAEEIMLTVAQMLGRHLQVSRCSYGLLEEDQDTCVIPGGLNDGVEPIVGAFRLSSFGPELVSRSLRGLPTVVRDVRREIDSPEAQAAYDSIQTRSYVNMPLVVGDRLVAIMSVDHKEPRDWSPEEIELMRLVTERSWGDIERARAERALRKSADRWRLLARLSDVLRSSGTATEIAHDVCALLAQELDLIRCTYTLVDLEQGLGFVKAEWVGDAPSVMGVHRLSDFGEDVWARSSRGETVVNRNVADDPATADKLGSYEAMGTRSFVHVPLVRDGKLVAFLDAHAGEPRPWGKEDVDLVKDVAARLWEAFERAAAEEELRKANATLEARVEARTEELTRANRDLEQFAYSVAHDLRAPLRSIVSSSRMLQEDAGDRLTSEERATLDRQVANALRLAKIVDDLLGFARLAEAEPKKRPFDISALAHRVSDEVAAQRGGCAVTVQEGMKAVGDPSLIGYVLTNLLDNACKFSPGGGIVTVGEEDGAFFVRDQGMGFDMAHAGKLFIAFERLVSQEIEGTGVGLANVRRIVEKHGGKVWAESEPGKGATFWFTLAN